MAIDLTVILEDRPGTLARVGAVLGQAGINIDGGCGFLCKGEGIIHLLVKEAEPARKALGSAGIEVRGERPVLVVEVVDQPGEFGKLAQRMANVGVNIELLYVTTNGQVVLGVDDLDKAALAAL